MEAKQAQPGMGEGRPPEPVGPGLWLFAPSRDTQGGSAWLLELPALDVLVDVPALTAANLHWLRERSGPSRPDAAPAAEPPRPGWIVLTGRHGHGRCRALQEALGWPVLVQEQEAYLLPSVRLETFAAQHRLADGVDLLWTPGPSPGSCVLHTRVGIAGDGLFCGRLLLPVGPGCLSPLRRRSTFHWPRQLASLERLRGWLPAGSPDWIASGGGLGALRGQKLVRHGASQLASLDLQGLKDRQQEPG